MRMMTEIVVVADVDPLTVWFAPVASSFCFSIHSLQQGLSDEPYCSHLASVGGEPTVLFSTHPIPFACFVEFEFGVLALLPTASSVLEPRSEMIPSQHFVLVFTFLLLQ